MGVRTNYRSNVGLQRIGTADSDSRWCHAAGRTAVDGAFAVYTALNPLVKDGATAQQAREVDTLFRGHPDYQWNKQEEARLRADLYRALRPLVGAIEMVEAANSLCGCNAHEQANHRKPGAQNTCLSAH